MKIASIRTRIAVGAFVLLVMFLATVLIFVSKEGQFFWSSRRSFELSLTDANGLQLGAPVRMAGLTIGEVTGMTLAFVDGKEAVRIIIDVIEPYYDMVHEGSRASLLTQGVLGDKFVALSGGDPNKPLLNAGSVIPSDAQIPFDRMMARASIVIDNMADVSTQLKAFTASLDNGPNIKELSSNLAQTSSHLRVLIENLARTDGTLAYLNSPDARAKLEVGLDNLSISTEAIQRITRKIDHGEGTLGLLINDAALHDGAQHALGQSNRRRKIEAAVHRGYRLIEKDSMLAH